MAQPPSSCSPICGTKNNSIALRSRLPLDFIFRPNCALTLPHELTAGARHRLCGMLLFQKLPANRTIPAPHTYTCLPRTKAPIDATTLVEGSSSVCTNKHRSKSLFL